MLVRIALATALLSAAPAMAAAPSDAARGNTSCVLTHQLAPHGKGVTTPIVKCDAKSAELARADAIKAPAQAPSATR